MNRHLLPMVAVPICAALVFTLLILIGVSRQMSSHSAAIVIRGGSQSGTSVPAVVDEHYAKAFATTLVSLRTNWTSSTYIERMRQVARLMNSEGKLKLQENVDLIIKAIRNLDQTKSGVVNTCEVTQIEPGLWEAVVHAKVKTYFGSFAGGIESMESRIRMRQVTLQPPNPYILIAENYEEHILERQSMPKRALQHQSDEPMALEAGSSSTAASSTTAVSPAP